MRPIKHINWMDLSGLLVGAFLMFALMVVGIVLYVKLFNSGMIGVEEYKLHSHFEKALGLSEGTKVQISGVDVGKISAIRLESNGVWLELTLQKKYQNWVTDSSTVFAIRDQNVISSRVVNIDVSRRGRVLEDGDSIKAGQAQDLETVLETANELLVRVGDLVDVVDTIVTFVMDTSTTLGALLGSKTFYSTISTQLTRLDDITRTGSHLLYSLDGRLPVLLDKTDTLVGDVQTVVTGVKDLPMQLNGIFNSMDGLFTRMDTLVTNFDGVASSLSGFIEVWEKTLDGADEMVEGLSNMWIIRRSIPQKDSVPFTVEALW